MLNNQTYDRIAHIINPSHFHDPVHAHIFELIASRIAKGNLASPITLRPFLEGEEALKALGGADYLVRLAGAAVASHAAADYARLIHDMALRRALIDLGRDMEAKAAAFDADTTPEDQVVEAEAALYHLSEQGRAHNDVKSFARAITEAVSITRRAYQREGGMAGLATGFIDLDKKLGGLHPSDLVILAGRPSMGKTALATNIAFQVAHRTQRSPDEGTGAAPMKARAGTHRPGAWGGRS